MPEYVVGFCSAAGSGPAIVMPATGMISVTLWKAEVDLAARDLLGG